MLCLVSGTLDRRAFLRLSGDFALLALAPRAALAEVPAARSAAGEDAGVFLSAGCLRALRALCAHWIPGPPQDPDPGAAEAGVAEYIDLLLGSFLLEFPRIFAGGPFSNRDGGGPDYFYHWLELDALDERIWRTRIEGSRGQPEREWNGPVRGWQEIYTSGLDALGTSGGSPSRSSGPPGAPRCSTGCREARTTSSSSWRTGARWRACTECRSTVATAGAWAGATPAGRGITSPSPTPTMRSAYPLRSAIRR